MSEEKLKRLVERSHQIRCAYYPDNPNTNYQRTIASSLILTNDILLEIIKDSQPDRFLNEKE